MDHQLIQTPRAKFSVIAFKILRTKTTLLIFNKLFNSFTEIDTYTYRLDKTFLGTSKLCRFTVTTF